MKFDDYLWTVDLSYEKDLIRCAKPAIDPFVNQNVRKRNVPRHSLYPLHIRKVGD